MRIRIALSICAILAMASIASGNEFTKRWKDLRDQTLKVADAMPASAYSFRPSPDDASFAEQLVQIGRSNDTTFAAISGGQSPFTMPDILDKTTVTKLLTDSFDYCSKILDGLKESDQQQALGAFVETAQRRGQCEAYVKVKDMKPAQDVNRRVFLFYGFLAAWLIVCAYVVAISLRESKLRAELDRVKRLIEDREPEKPERLRV